MITEDYVSFEVAKLLKENGFDSEGVSEVGGYYVDYNRDSHKIGLATESLMLNKDLGDNEYLRPTLQMAMKWLREVHKLHIILDIHWLYFANQNGWMYTISRILENGSEYVDSRGDENDKNFYSTYEEAAEAGIRYCLENLI